MDAHAVLAGRVALVTGASRGLGRAIAEALAGAGAAVACAARTSADVETTAGRIRAHGGRAEAFPLDVTRAEEITAVVRATEVALGPVDILVNNAGLTRDQLALRMKDEDWQKVIDVDLTAGFRLARAAMRGMMKRRWGRIVGITSVVGVTGNPGQANYAAAKAGMIGMSKALAAELASRGITVNCVAPGFIASAMTDALSEEQRARVATVVPMGRMGAPEEVAAGVLFLASDEARYVTGHTLHVNGGMAMI
jgi:3-oxoacyl-[acyl-carrier protein] reductase